MIEELLFLNHPNPWSYTPRQMINYLAIAHNRTRKRDAHQLAMMATASQGKAAAIQGEIRNLKKEV